MAFQWPWCTQSFTKLYKAAVQVVVVLFWRPGRAQKLKELVLDMYGDTFGGGYEAPVKVGERYRVRIESLGKGGDGIAKVKGFVIFVPNTQVGDEVEIVINSVKRKFAFGEVI